MSVSLSRVVSVALLAVSLTACAPPGSPRLSEAEKSAQAQSNVAEEMAVETVLRQDSRVVGAELAYRNSFPDYGGCNVFVEIDAKYADQAEGVLSLATRTIWLSRITPLINLSVRISWVPKEGGPQELTRTVYSSAAGPETLTKLFGQRPVPN